jgi:hypothetical protein
MSPAWNTLHSIAMREKLLNSFVGCHMGHVCLAVLAYANHVVILAPDASAMRHLLSLCDEFAAEFDFKFEQPLYVIFYPT